MRRLWAQLAALGVGRIILTNAARVERNYFDTHVLAPECYRPLLIEGLQQARDTRVPSVTDPPAVSQARRGRARRRSAMRRAARRATRPRPTTIRDAVVGSHGERVLLAVGPEGGWNAFELELLERHAFQRVSMGPRTLRSDTACVALIALCHEAIREI